MRTNRTFLLTFLGALLLPATALGCSLATSTTRPHIAPSDLRFLSHTVGERPTWAQDESWSSSRLRLTQSIQPRFARRPLLAAYAQQRSIQVIASRPMDGVYGEDQDPATSCALLGRRVYSATRLIVRETAQVVSITLASHRTPGSTAGCSVSSTSCDDTVLRTVSLRERIGARRLQSLAF